MTISPHHHARRVLLLVIGLTPQVVTETLYALAVLEDPPWIPTEIHLLTTREGADRATLMLLDPDEGRFFQLLDEYDLDRESIDFSESHIHVMTGADGEPLSDIRTEEDNRRIADAIAERVRAFTEDPDCALHASIAGGRKTMGFYLGYVLSLFGRPQDRLSHVLINPPFESDHQFYYPPARPRRLIINDRPAHTRDARVMLADIPFVRLREGLPKRLLEGKARFVDTVNAAQKALQPPTLEIDLKEGTLTAADERVPMTDAQLAFYSVFAQRRIRGLEPARWEDDTLAERYYHFYRLRVGEMSLRLDSAEKMASSGMDKEWFEQQRSKTNRALKEALGEPLAKLYAIDRHGERPHTRYGLNLPPEAIRLQAGEGTL